jgi:hypothetical protein
MGGMAVQARVVHWMFIIALYHRASRWSGAEA